MDWLFLLRLKNDGMFQLHCTHDVFAEVLANLRKRYPRLPGHRIRLRFERMTDHIDEVLDTFSGDLEFTGQDPNDYHIHAAAIHCRSDFVLTDNKPTDITTVEQHYEIVTPDSFFTLVADSARPGMLYPIIRKQLDYFANKPDKRQLDEALERAGCPQFATRVRAAIQEMVRKGLV